jgi:hypothetical protein
MVHSDHAAQLISSAGASGGWKLVRRCALQFQVKMLVVRTYHKSSVKHLHAHLDELEYRFNSGENKFLFQDTLLKLVAAEKLPHEQPINLPNDVIGTF